MLRGGAWCAGLGCFVAITALCAWMAYRTARISHFRARFDSWIDLQPPHYDEYTDYDATAPLPINSNDIQVTHEITPEDIMDHLTTSPTIKITELVHSSVRSMKITDTSTYEGKVTKSKTKIPPFSRLMPSSTVPYSSRRIIF